jgi:hypothetical protein
MAIRIESNRMSSDQIRHYAVWNADAAADGTGAWVVSWLPLRLLTRNQATTAMVLADLLAGGLIGPGHRTWPAIQGWAAELHMTAPDVAAAVAAPPADLPPASPAAGAGRAEGSDR